MATALTYVKVAEAAVTVALDSLGAGAYVDSSAITPDLKDSEHHLRVTIADIAEAGNEVIGVYLLPSNDGVTFATSEDDSVPVPVGVVPMTGSSAAVVKWFALAEKFGGTLPIAYKIRFKDDAGAALAPSGNSAGIVAVQVTNV